MAGIGDSPDFDYMRAKIADLGKIDFVLICSFAVVAHGSSMLTRDIDVCCRFSSCEPVVTRPAAFIIRDIHSANCSTSSRKSRKSVSGTGRNRLQTGMASSIFYSVANDGMSNSFPNRKLLNNSMLRHFLWFLDVFSGTLRRGC